MLGRSRRGWGKRWRPLVACARAHVCPFLIAPCGDLRFRVDVRDRKGRQLYVGGHRTEFGTLERAVRWLEEARVPSRGGGTFVDCGAWVGTAAIAAMVRHGFDRAVAIEPHPVSHSLLVRNLVLNGLEGRSVAVCAAATATSGTLPFIVKTTASRSRIGPGERARLVDAVSLDDLVARGVIEPASVGMLWLDVEGHEEAVLQGAATVIASSPPLVLEVRQVDLNAGLDRRLLALLGDRYTHAVDLRADAPLWFPVERLRETRAGGSLKDQTDMLVVRLPAA